MDEKVSKEQKVIEWIRTNSVAFITVMIPVVLGLLTAFLSICNRIYLQEYYKYFNIDLKYVSIHHYWDFKEKIVLVFFYVMMLVCLIIGRALNRDENEIGKKKKSYYEKIKDDKTVSPKVIKYLKKDIRKSNISGYLYVFINIFGLFSWAVFLFAYVLGNDPFEYETTNDVGIVSLVFAILFFLILYSYKIDDLLFGRSDGNNADKQKFNAEKIYKKIFPVDKNDECFKERQLEVINGYHEQSKNEEKNHKVFGAGHFVIFLIGALFAIMLWYMGTGTQAAMNQREFLVAEDNEHVAIPVSEDRYALIDIREENDCLILLIGKQNFHESNDFPCIRKTYSDVKIEPLEWI